MKAALVTISSSALIVCSLLVLGASEAHADAIPGCPPDQHLVTGTPSSGHHGGGHCEPGPDPRATPSASPSSSAGGGKKSGGGCALSSRDTSSSPVAIGVLLLPLAAIALRRGRRRRLPNAK